MATILQKEVTKRQFLKTLSLEHCVRGRVQCPCTGYEELQIDVSFLCVCSVIDDKLCCNLVKVAVEPQAAAKRFILSICTLIDDKNEPISMREIRQLL